MQYLTCNKWKTIRTHNISKEPYDSNEISIYIYIYTISLYNLRHKISSDLSDDFLSTLDRYSIEGNQQNY